MTTIPEVNARILDLVDKGYESGQIIDILREEEERKINPMEEEVFPDAVRMTAQALAFRTAELSDVDDVYEVLRSAYLCEMNGDEAFLSASTHNISKDEILKYISDSSYKFILLEAPNGYEIEHDGFVLGATCYSTDGESKKNGKVEGRLASIRYLGVRPKYQHCMVGHRLLSKIENDAKKAGCCRIMACVASTRNSITAWLDRRGYFHGATMPYPVAMTDNLLHKDTCLHAYLKELDKVQEVGPQIKGRANMSPIWRMAASATGEVPIPDVD